MRNITVIDYGSGNLRSVAKALERAAREAELDFAVSVSADPKAVLAADRILLPGVGAFAAAMDGLSACDGLLEAMQHQVLIEQRPFLGICVGMQVLAEQGLEFKSSDGLGWIPGTVRPLEPGNALRTPHMGWNSVAQDGAAHPLLAGLDGEAFYFAHSFHFDAENEAHVIGVTGYGGRIVTGVARDNIAGLQFHPEKSQTAGLRCLQNFLKWRP